MSDRRHDDDPAADAATDVLHLDMDCFYAQVEMLAEPALRGRPVVVGGTGNRGVVCSASYEARIYGIRSAMPTVEARRRCPQAVFLAPRFDAYGKASERLFELVREVTPVVEPIALDEAYLDVSGAHRLFGSSQEIAATLRLRVFDDLALTCSVGVARTKLLAKLASEAAKPVVEGDVVRPGAGVVVIERPAELDFLHAHPIEAVPGIGPRTAEKLHAVGVHRVGELAELGAAHLERRFGRAHGSALHELSQGRDPRRVVADRAARSVGHEQTFEHDDRDPDSLASKARELAVSVTQRCRRAGLVGRTVTVKVKFPDFSTQTRSKTVTNGFASSAELGEAAVALLAKVEISRGIRLLGVHVSGFSDSAQVPGEQLDLFGEGDASESEAERERRVGLDEAADEIRRRFGSDAIASVAAAARRGERHLPSDTTGAIGRHTGEEHNAGD